MSMADLRTEQLKGNVRIPTLPASIDDKDTNQHNDRPTGFGIRHQFAVVSCFVFFNLGALRANLGLTIVSMVKTASSNTTESTKSGCHGYMNETTTKDYEVISDSQFDWDEETQGILLASFFYGYMLTQIPGGRMPEVFGPKIVIGLGILVTSVCTLVTPVSAHLHIGALLAVRVVLGLSQGVVLPCMYFMIGKWIPRSETTTITVFIYSGIKVGFVVSMAISGVMCSSEFLGGWPSVFYAFGISGCVSTAFWFRFVYDSPAVHPKISDKERIYIERSVGIKKNLKIPYRSIITSSAVWAICIAHLSYNWGDFTIMTTLPTYMNRIQNIDVSKNGVLMSVLYVICWIVSLLSGIVSDCIRRRKWLSTTNTRKLFNSLGVAILVLVKLAGCNQVTVVTLIVSSAAIATLTDSGFNVNHIDIAPNFAGTLYGISNTLATLSGIIAPYIVGILTKNNQTVEQWQIVFYTTAAWYTFGGITFLVFARGTIQKWNK